MFEFESEKPLHSIEEIPKKDNIVDVEKICNSFVVEDRFQEKVRF